MLKNVAFICVFACLFHSTAFADEMKEVTAPRLFVGMTWVYKRTDNLLKIDELRTEKVAKIESNNICIVSDSDLFGRGGNCYDLELNVVIAGRFTNSPADIQYKWPLKPTANWSNEFSWKGPDRQGKTSMKAQVVGWEKITVPAGTYNALKITQEGNYTNFTENVRGVESYAYWYVPEVSRYVRFERKVRFNNNLIVDFTTVLFKGPD